MPFFHSPAGAEIYYEETGTGTPLILVHGWAMSGRAWRFQRPLAERFRLIEVDLQGHGRSSITTAPLSLAGLAADVAALVDHLELQHCVLVGWSLGAMVVLRSIAFLRSRIDGLVVVGGTARFVEEPGYHGGLPLREVRGLEVRITRDYRKTMGEFFRRMFAAGELTREQENRIAHEVLMDSRLPELEVARQGLAVLAAEDLRPTLPEIDRPVFLIHGESDTICPPQGAETMAALLPMNELHILKGRGHAPFLSHPHEFNTLVDHLIRSLHGRN